MYNNQLGARQRDPGRRYDHHADEGGTYRCIGRLREGQQCLPPPPHGGIGCIRAGSGAFYRASVSFPGDFSEKLRRGFRQAHHIPSEARGKSPSSKGMTADCTRSLCPVFVSVAAPAVFVVRSRLVGFRRRCEGARRRCLCARACRGLHVGLRVGIGTWRAGASTYTTNSTLQRFFIHERRAFARTSLSTSQSRRRATTGHYTTQSGLDSLHRRHRRLRRGRRLLTSP